MKVKFWKMHCLDWKTRYDTGRTITSRILITKGLNHNSISKYLNHTDVRKCPRFSLRNLSLIPTLIVRIWFYIMMVERKIPSCFFCDKVAPCTLTIANCKWRLVGPPKVQNVQVHTIPKKKEESFWSCKCRQDAASLVRTRNSVKSCLFFFN